MRKNLKLVYTFTVWEVGTNGYPIETITEMETFYMSSKVIPTSNGIPDAICLNLDDVPIGYVNVSMEKSHDFGYGKKSILVQRY